MLPLVTLLAIAVSVVAAYSDGLTGLLIYDRQDVTNGEFWRLATGSLAHFSASHLWYNSAALVVAGAIAEWHCPRRFAILLGSAMLAVGGTIHFLAPHLETYAGLSGVVYAAIAFVAVERLWFAQQRRWLCIGMIAGLCAKTSYEWLTGGTLFASYDGGVAVAPVSHLAGMFLGVTVAAWLTPSAATRKPSWEARLRFPAASPRTRSWPDR